MNGSKDNNGRRAWKAIYAQWDRERLEEELVRNADQFREIRNERNQLQSRVRQLEEENRWQQAELTRLEVTNKAFAARVITGGSGGHGPPDMQEGGEGEGAAEAASAEPEPESPWQNSGRFHVSPAEVMCPDPMPSRGFSEGVLLAERETEREMARRAAQQEEQHRNWYERDTGFC